MQRGVYATNALSFKYKDGIIAGIDTGSTYGSLSIKDSCRIFKVTENCIILFSGIISDIQFLKKFLKEEFEQDNMRKMDPQGIHKMLARIFYSKRSQGTPLSASAVVCGINPKTNEIFQSTDEQGRIIGAINSKGNFWFDDHVALSFSANLILPLLRERNVKDLSKEEAIEFMEECFRILCYKDCRSTNRIQIAIIEKNNISIEEPYTIKTDWSIGLNVGEILL